MFADRRDAGRQLGARLVERYAGRDDVVVLGLPRGGVPVAGEVAAAIGAPLDVFVVRKLPTPGQPELALGAIASGGALVLNDEIVRAARLDEAAVQRVVEAETHRLHERERLYRGDRPPLDLRDRTAIVVDDGLATGASMRAAIAALRDSQVAPAAIVVAVPVAPASTCRALASEVDGVVCAVTPEPFFAVGSAYLDFTQTTDDEVRSVLG